MEGSGMTKAKLTELQDKRYGQLFEIGKGQGMSDLAADCEAWEGLCEEWPELREFDGAEA
jgi:hypothetical protein